MKFIVGANDQMDYQLEQGDEENYLPFGGHFNDLTLHGNKDKAIQSAPNLLNIRLS